MDLFERLEQLFSEIEAKTGLKKNRVLLEAGIDPAQYRAYKRASRLLSDDMLDRLGKSAHVHIPAARLKAWKAIDAFGPDVINESMQVLGEPVESMPAVAQIPNLGTEPPGPKYEPIVAASTSPTIGDTAPAVSDISPASGNVIL